MTKFSRSSVFLSWALLYLVSGCVVKNTINSSSTLNAAISQDQNLAITPPMGWNSWNAFGKNVNEQVIRETADAMVSSAMTQVGFSYIVIDDIWQGGRDSSTGLLYADAKKFPSGMKALADYVHSKGLKFGIYSDAGTKTCGEMPGSFGYEKKDAKLFADWGVDFLKYDYCFCPDYVSANNDYKMAISRYKAMGDALKATGRPILFSICEWGPRSPWLWGKEVGGHMWRTSYDVADIWDKPRNETSPVGILTSIDVMTNLGRFSGPGGWNDPDMLVVGLNNTGFIKGGGCNDIEYRTQMSMWCMFSAPLMLGCDIRNMNEVTKTIILNKDIIDIDQDSLGKQGYRVMSKDGLEAWKKPLTGNRIAIALFNRNSSNKTITASWKDLELEPGKGYSIFDVWKHSSVGQEDATLSADLQPHECQVFVLSAKKNK
ncbi:glycoside hydrolase family 27 protein [Segetibacter koreensis]|uniref:glycoside hydrolase family 27 protein n=1 Tax=Segetibacter koreensis TaxID=398037 RepID=UPI0003A73AAE|nr:glycoside hydrolase family 27 protein [Segetibacter koreensis]